MFNELIALATEIVTTDEIGNDVSKLTERQVFCEIKSCSQTEFFSAAQNGMRTDYKVKMWRFDYADEKIAKIGTVKYDIYRTYIVDDYIELYLSQKVGLQ